MSTILLETVTGSTTISAPCTRRRVVVGVSKIVKNNYCGKLIVRQTTHGKNLVTWVYELVSLHEDDKDNLMSFIEASRNKMVNLSFNGEAVRVGRLATTEQSLPHVSNQKDLTTNQTVLFYDVTLTLEELR